MAAAMVAGCRGQVPAPESKTDRHIEVLMRSQLGVPGDWTIQVGKPEPSSTIAGYDTVAVTFTPPDNPTKAQTLDLLLSKDGTKLARLSTWDLNTLPTEHLDVAGRPVRGSDAAKVEIVNYDDLECPYCARMHAQLFPETLDHYKGLVKIVYKDDPLVEIHPWALHAAVDANCLAGVSGEAYWHYVDYLHTHGEDVTGPDRDAAKSDATLDKLARAEGAKLGGAKAAELESCVAKQDPSAVRASMDEAAKLNIDGTPTLFVDGERITGAQPLEVVWNAVDRALRAQGITPPPRPSVPAPDGKAAAPASGTGGAE
jgi:protein-disulfide isomerase